MKSRLLYCIMPFMALLCMTTGVLGEHAVASVNDFTITNFNADYYLGKQDPQGSMRVTEHIDVIFKDYNHGIFRAIPQSYRGHPTHVSVTSVKKNDGSAWKYTTSTQNDNLVLKIGDPDQTVTGAQSFVIDYSLDNVITFYDSHDELYWDVNGDQWQQPALAVKATLHLLDGLKLSDSYAQRSTCFTGVFGSTAHNCTISYDQQNATLTTAITQPLQANENLSFVTGFTKGTFTPYGSKDTITEHLGDIAIAAAAIGLLTAGFRQWYKFGRDYKGLGTVVPEYQPPTGIDALKAGVLQDNKLDGKDLTAVIIGLAVRGYIKIIETDTKKLGGLIKSNKTELQLVTTDPAGTSNHEQKILQALFSTFQPGEKVELGSYISGFSSAQQSVQKAVLKELTDQGFYERNPKYAATGIMYAVLVGAIGCIVLSFMLHAWYGLIAAVVATAVIFILLALMPRRSKEGQDTNDHLKGLKLFLQTTEKDRMSALQGPNAKLAANAGEPVRTVELFEKMLPFAIIFGVEKGWADQFKDIYTTPPDWYSGNWTTFNSAILASHLSSATVSAIGSSVTPPSSSSSSGFGGGGFSGGGGGGGGGGGW